MATRYRTWRMAGAVTPALLTDALIDIWPLFAPKDADPATVRVTRILVPTTPDRQWSPGAIEVIVMGVAVRKGK